MSRPFHCTNQFFGAGPFLRPGQASVFDSAQVLAQVLAQAQVEAHVAAQVVATACATLVFCSLRAGAVSRKICHAESPVLTKICLADLCLHHQHCCGAIAIELEKNFSQGPFSQEPGSNPGSQPRSSERPAPVYLPDPPPVVPALPGASSGFGSL